MTFAVLFLVLALVFFILAACSIPMGRCNPTAVGLACLTLWFLGPVVIRIG